MGRAKNCQDGLALRKLVGLRDSAVKGYRRGAQTAEITQKPTVNASKTRMDFFPKHWEQNTGSGCLKGSLSGKGQTFLTAPIPAPGGDQ